MAISRKQVGDKLEEFYNGETTKTKAVFTSEITSWLASVEATDLEKSQILGDLESYYYFHLLTI